MPTMPLVHEVQPSRRRLDSWKEIAAFFDRDERTVKRWEKERSLPVHRLPGGSRGRVFAFADELSLWMHSSELAAAEAPLANQPSEAASLESSATGNPTAPTGAAAASRLAGIRLGKRWIVLAAGAVLAAMVGTPWVVAHRRQTSPLAVNGSSSSPGSPATTSATRTTDPEAEEFYLKGRYYWNKRTPEDLNKAIDYFTQAIVRDPNHAQAYVGLADCYNLLREFAAMPSEEAFPRALAAARKAVELDESSAEANASLAFVLFYWNWDIAGAERTFRRAIELNPDYVAAHHWYATFLMTLGRYPEAMKEIERAQELDPASSAILADKALLLFHQGDPERATELLRQIEASQPAFFSPHKYLSYIYLAKRDYRNYLVEATKSATLSHDAEELAVLRAAEQGFNAGGGQGMLAGILRLQKKLYAEGRLPAYAVAETCARLGRKEEALRYLQTAYERHETAFLSLRVDEGWSSLHDDPAYRQLLAQAGFPPLP